MFPSGNVGRKRVKIAFDHETNSGKKTRLHVKFGLFFIQNGEELWNEKISKIDIKLLENRPLGRSVPNLKTKH